MTDDDGPLIRVALHTWPAWIDAPATLDAEMRLFLAASLVEVTEGSQGQPGYRTTPDPGYEPSPEKNVQAPERQNVQAVERSNARTLERSQKPMPKGPCAKCKTMSWVPNGTGWKCGKCRP